uniref:Mercuric resistance operon coregulator n=1 Tax=Klebsiella pneumoniae TaxID=573 RepID=A0A7G5F6J1_KLEPN|nr:Mercuric resistance operon coregulator [Klebsiella pneumoniae]
MSAYTVSRLALDAGVSVHIVRDYLLRGLLRPVAYTGSDAQWNENSR